MGEDQTRTGSVLTRSLAATVESGIGAYLRQDPASRGRMRGLVGKAVAVELRALNIALYFVIGSDRVRVHDHLDRPVDATLIGTPLDLLRAATSADDAGTAASGAIVIKGDTETAQDFSRLLTDVEIDWEEHLSRACGDTIAHKTVTMLRELRRWSLGTMRTLEEDAGDFLREETRLLPNRDEIEVWSEAIDALRADTDRMQKRVERAEMKHGPAGKSPPHQERGAE
jgi:ubiquinone biosynthesis protein UbiJ